MTEEERIFRGELFASEEPELVEKKRRAHRLSQKYNETFEDDAEVREAILRELLGELGEGVCMLGPVRFHYGCHTRVGNHCFMNFNFTVQDDALVTIGDHCNFGPNVTIDLLTLSRFDSGRAELKLAPFPFGQAVQDVYNANLMEAQRHGHAMELDITEELPEITGDRERIDRSDTNGLGAGLNARLPSRLCGYSTPLQTLTTKSCTLVTMVRTDRLPRSRSLFTANSDTSTE